jgi:demethylmenaquinone methyltransferase/2-methoxy-6-polyprenyl-1,4-benzoquinol methylase
MLFAASAFIIVAAAIAYYASQARYPSTDAPAGSGAMFDSVAPFYDIANRFMSFGFDQSWRKSLVTALHLSTQDAILDVSTGTADVAIQMAYNLKRLGKHSGNSIVGLDPSANMLAYGAAKLKKDNIHELVSLVQGDAQDMVDHRDESFDKISQSFGIRNVPDRLKALNEMYRVMRPGGMIGIMEFSAPHKGPLQPLAMFFLRTILPLIGRILSGGLKSEYDHLRDSIINFPTPPEFVKLMESAGFSNCATSDLFFDTVYLYTCTKSA